MAIRNRGMGGHENRAAVQRPRAERRLRDRGSRDPGYRGFAPPCISLLSISLGKGVAPPG